jgi:glutamate-1-semialdehyde aminotransferase
MGDNLREKIGLLLGERGMPHKVCGKSSLFLAHLTDTELTDYRSLRGYSRTNPVYGELCHELLARGIIISPRGIFGCLSTPMGQDEIDAFIEALDESLTALDYRA